MVFRTHNECVVAIVKMFLLALGCCCNVYIHGQQLPPLLTKYFIDKILSVIHDTKHVGDKN